MILKLICTIIITTSIFSCNKNTRTSPYEKTDIIHHVNSEKNQTTKDSILYKISKNCSNIKYEIGLNLSKQYLVIKRDNDTFNVPSTKLVQELSDKEMVTDFWINCDCIFNGLKINYEFDLYHYKSKYKSHFVFFKEKEVILVKALSFYSDKNQENLFGLDFKNNITYSYDNVNENEFIELIKFENFQNENYNQNINNYFDEIKKLFSFKDYNQLKLKGDTIVLKQSLKNVSINSALTKYNDIAYYLEQSKAYEEAVFLLEKIVELFPNRTVAYVNLGDAYWGLQNYTEAKEAYRIYTKQMKALGRENKIPNRIIERIKTL